MNVIQARKTGMCFGVRDALAVVENLPAGSVIYGELVHNPVVLDKLARRGIQSLPEPRRQPPVGRTVVITAHGVSQAERGKLQHLAKQVYDTTCPLVQRLHHKTLELKARGCFIVIIGKADHVEVKGLTGDLGAFAVAGSVEAVETYPRDLLGVVCQTTTLPELAAKVLRRIEEKNPAARIEYADTICKPTRERQTALAELLAQVEIMVVVGGANSNNTRQLSERCRRSGVPCIQVENARELPLARLRRYHTAGVAAGTSTLDETIAEVCEVLRSCW